MLDRESTGMALMTKLIEAKPIAGDKAYNIYRDIDKKLCIDYIMLSNHLHHLDLEDHIEKRENIEYVVLYFNLDNDMNWDSLNV